MHLTKEFSRFTYNYIIKNFKYKNGKLLKIQNDLLIDVAWVHKDSKGVITRKIDIVYENKRKQIFEHKLIYLYFTQDYPKKLIHKDGNKLNNTIENLIPQSELVKLKTSKHCYACKEELPLTSFHKDKSRGDGLSNICKKCNRERARKTVRNTEKLWESEIKRLYGITIEEYNELKEKQNNKCAICGTDEKNLIKKLAVDHCHTTGKVRGLLCRKCNSGIGFLQDDIEVLTNAIKYLKKYE